MTFSPLTRRTLTTSKRSSRFGTKISRVIVHHWAGTAGGIERLVYSSDKASANYIILTDGTIIGSVPEKYRAWTSGSAAADRPSITVEVQNSTRGPDWKVSDAAIASLERLIADIAKRYGWSNIREGHEVRGHRSFASTACPGPYLWPRLGTIAKNALTILRGSAPKPAPAPSPSPSPAPGRNSHAKRPYKPGEVKAIQEALAYAGFYTGVLDDDYGQLTHNAVAAYQRSQLFGNLVPDGDWGPATQKHYEWVKSLQKALNKWKSSLKKLVVDGSYGQLGKNRVYDVQKRNLGTARLPGAYWRAGGRVVDDRPGPVTCKMLGISNYPN